MELPKLLIQEEKYYYVYFLHQLLFYACFLLYCSVELSLPNITADKNSELKSSYNNNQD
jgi:hypothetical protein